MTQKELSYVEDAVGHEGNIIKIINEGINNLEDENLVTFMNQELETHTSMKEKLMTLLEGKANE
jgi:hypothetical protein